MPDDSEPFITEAVSRKLRKGAMRHLTDALKIWAATPAGERGTAMEQAAMLIAMAQAEATLNVMGQLEEVINLSSRTERTIKALGDLVASLDRPPRRKPGD